MMTALLEQYLLETKRREELGKSYTEKKALAEELAQRIEQELEGKGKLSAEEVLLLRHLRHLGNWEKMASVEDLYTEIAVEYKPQYNHLTTLANSLEEAKSSHQLINLETFSEPLEDCGLEMRRATERLFYFALPVSDWSFRGKALEIIVKEEYFWERIYFNQSGFFVPEKSSRGKTAEALSFEFNLWLGKPSQLAVKEYNFEYLQRTVRALAALYTEDTLWESLWEAVRYSSSDREKLVKISGAVRRHGKSDQEKFEENLKKGGSYHDSNKIDPMG